MSSQTQSSGHLNKTEMKFLNEIEAAVGFYQVQLQDPDRPERWEAGSRRPHLCRIESREHFVSEWLIPVLAGTVFVGFLLVAAFTLLRN